MSTSDPDFVVSPDGTVRRFPKKSAAVSIKVDSARTKPQLLKSGLTRANSLSLSAILLLLATALPFVLDLESCAIVFGIVFGAGLLMFTSQFIGLLNPKDENRRQELRRQSWRLSERAATVVAESPEFVIDPEGNVARNPVSQAEAVEFRQLASSMMQAVDLQEAEEERVTQWSQHQLRLAIIPLALCLAICVVNALLAYLT